MKNIMIILVLVLIVSTITSLCSGTPVRPPFTNGADSQGGGTTIIKEWSR